MPTARSPRKGSLQFWPRKRAEKFLPRVNWNTLTGVANSTKGLKGFIAYKAGMVSGYVLDNTQDSMTKGKRIVIPLTVLECPKAKIFSVRFYKNNQPIKEIVSKNLEKELKKVLKIPKKESESLDKVPRESYDDVKVIIYSMSKQTNIKKVPDLSEVDLTGSLDEKLSFINENLNKELSALDVFEKGKCLDVRGLTKGKGLQGPVRRFGITLKSHKSEKGQRRPGSLAPWNPSRVTFRTPMAGQLGMFSRIAYNLNIIDAGNAKSENAHAMLKNIKNFGDVKTDYILVRGSVQGPAKRQLLLTAPFRQTKKQTKKNFQLLELR